MDEKSNASMLRDTDVGLCSPTTTPPAQASRRRLFSVYLQDRRLRRVCLATFLSIAAWMLVRTFIASPRVYKQRPLPPQDLESDWVLVKNSSKTVALEAHIMSKCPDAKDCLQQLVVPAMEQISDKVDFQLSYIGR